MIPRVDDVGETVLDVFFLVLSFAFDPQHGEVALRERLAAYYDREEIGGKADEKVDRSYRDSPQLVHIE